MKGIFFISVTTLTLVSLIGCQTVPRHLVSEEVVIIYYEPIYYDPPYSPHPPTPRPPITPVKNPIVNVPPSRDSQTKNQNNDGSYGKRDPLQGGDKTGKENIKSDPPVRKPVQNDRVQ